MVGLGRVELPTSPLSGVRSNQLSYRPVLERCHNLPGARRLSQNLIQLKKVSRTRLNVLGSYAADDHRAMAIKQRRLVSGFPRLPSGTALAGLDGQSASARDRFTSGAVRYRGRNASAIISLLERR